MSDRESTQASLDKARKWVELCRSTYTASFFAECDFDTKLSTMVALFEEQDWAAVTRLADELDASLSGVTSANEQQRQGKVLDDIYEQAAHLRNGSKGV